MHLLDDRVNHARRLHCPGRAHEQVLRAEDPRELLIRDIDLGMKAPLWTLAEDVADNSYDGKPGSPARSRPHPQLFSKRILPRPVHSGELLIHDHDSGGALRIVLVETAPSNQGNLQGAEIAGAGHNIISVRHLSSRGIRLVISCKKLSRPISDRQAASYAR